MKFNRGAQTKALALVGRRKKPAKQQNYKITYSLLAKLRAISILEDRSETAQLELWLEESADRWLSDNPRKTDAFHTLADKYLRDLQSEAEHSQAKVDIPDP